MLEILLYLKRYQNEKENAVEEERFVLVTRDLLLNGGPDVPTGLRYNYGRVVIKNSFYCLLDEECELDFFISCIQDDKEAILSGRAHEINNSYFKLVFRYRGKLELSFASKSVVVAKQEFIDAFRTSAETYYKLLAAVKHDRQYYEDQLHRLRAEWPPHDRGAGRR